MRYTGPPMTLAWFEMKEAASVGGLLSGIAISPWSKANLKSLQL
jgi:hypothetical protein